MHGRRRRNTREKVERALAALDYRPNLSARDLRKGRTAVIALALPELDAPHFSELTRFVIGAAGEHGWTVLTEQSAGDPDHEREVLDGIREQRIDGLIFNPITVGPEELTAERTPPSRRGAATGDVADLRTKEPSGTDDMREPTDPRRRTTIRGASSADTPAGIRRQTAACRAVWNRDNTGLV
ncbi:hypothetical protein ABZ079_15995 [Streptomyces sp. NPDC006314]|uniref:hypothetical protein n=1 Tax=Streptomyces sp. NPDC006314 TaxID=3154475 RepID=UPI0033A05F2A